MICTKRDLPSPRILAMAPFSRLLKILRSRAVITRAEARDGQRAISQRKGWIAVVNGRIEEVDVVKLV